MLMRTYKPQSKMQVWANGVPKAGSAVIFKIKPLSSFTKIP